MSMTNKRKANTTTTTTKIYIPAMDSQQIEGKFQNIYV